MKRLIFLTLFLLSSFVMFSQEDVYWKKIFHEGIDVYDSLDAPKIVTDSLMIREVGSLPSNLTRPTLVFYDDSIRLWDGTQWNNLQETGSAALFEMDGDTLKPVSANKLQADSIFTNYLKVSGDADVIGDVTVTGDIDVSDNGYFDESLNALVINIDTVFADIIEADSIYTKMIQIGDGSIKMTENNNNLHIDADTSYGEHYKAAGNMYAYKFVQSGYNASDLDIYIAPQTGSDETGDGSSGNPYKTLEGALNTFAPIQAGTVKIYYTENGTENLTQDILNLFGDINWSNNVKIYGDTAIVRDDFTATTHSDPDNDWVKQALSDPGGTPMTWAANTYRGYIARMDNSAPTYTLAPIGNHGIGELSASSFNEGFWAGAILTPEDTLHFPDNALYTTNGLTAGRKIKFYYFYITHGSKSARFTEEFSFIDCIIKQTTNKVMRNYGGVINDVLFLSDNTNITCMINQNGYKGDYVNCQVINTNPASTTSGCYAFEFLNTNTTFRRMRIIGFPQVFRTRINTSVGNYYGHYPNQFEDCGVVWSIDGSNNRYIDGESYGQNQIKLFNVNYLFSLNGGDEDMNYTFEEGKIVNWDDSLEYAVFVPDAGGMWQGNPTALPSERDKPDRYIDPVKQVSFYVYGLIYPEIDYGSETLVDNDTTDIVIGRKSQNKVIKLTYECERNNQIEFGEVNVINYDDSLKTSPEFYYGDEIGLSFAPTVYDNDSIVLKPVLTNTGYTGALKFDVNRIMK